MLRILVLPAILMASSPALAADIDFFTTSSTGCDDQWETDCVSNVVWGPSNSLAHCEAGSEAAIFMEAGTKIGLAKEALPSTLRIVAGGEATDANSTVEVLVQYFNSNDVIVGSEVVSIHSGSAGTFNTVATLSTFPSGAVKWRGRVEVANSSILIWILVGCGGDECTKTCPDGSTVTGVKCGTKCEATCPPEEEEVEECETTQ